VVLADGHVDYGARLIEGSLQSQIKDSTSGSVVWREPADVVFRLGPTAKATVPSNPKLAFLGRPGDPVWLIPQTQRSGVLWAGWNTEELRSPEVTGQVAWRLAAVEGPGTVAVDTVNALGDPSILFSSGDGLPDARDVPLGTHAHGNWAFSRAGTYRLRFEMSATLGSGQVSIDAETLTVTVVDEGSPGPPGGGDQPPGGGSPGPGAPPGAAPLTLKLSSASLRGRSLRLRLRLSAKSRVSVSARRNGRTAARARARDVPSGTRTLKVLLNRRLRPGRYTIRVHARAGDRTITRSVALRVARRAP
jgi:surface-anchored protein